MDKIWYAVYVKSRSEKKVASELVRMGIDHYLPMQKVLKQWSDRKKWVEEPLFRSYIFVQISQLEYYNVLNVRGAIRYITFEGKAVPVPEQQIEAIKYYLNEKDPELLEDLHWEKGQKVEVISGSLIGLTGELVELKGKHKVNVEIEAVGRSILLRIPKNKLRVIN
jgi:transcription antitermination factor NusG